MTFKQRDMSGALFKNKDKTEDKHPNLKGSATIDGVEYWLSGWTKPTTDGNRYVSLAFKRKS